MNGERVRVCVGREVAAIVVVVVMAGRASEWHTSNAMTQQEWLAGWVWIWLLLTRTTYVYSAQQLQ